MAREITYNNFEISLVVFMPNITTNHAIAYTNFPFLMFPFCPLLKEFFGSAERTQLRTDSFVGGLRRLSRQDGLRLGAPNDNFRKISVRKTI